MGVRSITCNCGTEVEVDGPRPKCPNEDCGNVFNLGGQGLGLAPSAQSQGKTTEEEVRDFYTRIGCAVYKASAVGRTVGVSKGIPDLIVFGNDRHPGMWFHEVKSGGASLSDEQRAFQEECHKAGIPHVVGNAMDAADYLGLLD